MLGHIFYMSTPNTPVENCYMILKNVFKKKIRAQWEEETEKLRMCMWTAFETHFFC